MRSLINHIRNGHLGWRAGDVEVGKSMDEELTDAAKHTLFAGKPHPHLENLKPLASEHFENHVPSLKQKDAWNDHVKAIGSKGQNHVGWYKGDSSITNKALRRGQVSGLDDEHRNHIHQMERVTSSPTLEHMNVYRGIERHAGLHDLAPGDHFVDHGFTGTSLDKHSAHDFGSEHYEGAKGIPHDLVDHHMIARIHVPAGTKGHFLDAQRGTHQAEQEFLLHRGTKFQITGHSKSHINHGNNVHKVHVIHMRVVGQNPQPLHQQEEEPNA